MVKRAKRNPYVLVFALNDRKCLRYTTLDTKPWIRVRAQCKPNDGYVGPLAVCQLKFVKTLTRLATK